MFNKPNNEHSTMVITFCKKHNQWETHTVNISETGGVTRNNPIFVSKEVEKAVVKSSNEGNDLKSEQGKSSVEYPHAMVVIPTPPKLPNQ